MFSVGQAHVYFISKKNLDTFIPLEKKQLKNVSQLFRG